MSWPEPETRRGSVVVNGTRVAYEITIDWAMLAWQLVERADHNKSGKTSAMMGAVKARRIKENEA